MAIKEIQPRRGELLFARERKWLTAVDTTARAFRWKVELNACGLAHFTRAAPLRCADAPLRVVLWKANKICNWWPTNDNL